MKNQTGIDHLKLYDLFCTLGQCEENLILQGNMSDEMTVPLIDYSSIAAGEKNISQKKLSFFIAESFQNIIRHGKSDKECLDSNVKPGTYGVSKGNNSITLHSSNLISEQDAIQLDDTLKGLSILSPDELKEVYISALSDNELSSKGGAGLGLIEMVRKSKGQIRHNIQANNKESFFHFDVSLSKGEPEHNGSEHPSSTDLHQLMKENEISFLIKAKFNHEKFIQLNDIINRKIIDSNHAGFGNIHQMNYFFIEMIQNIYRHGESDSKPEKEGIFLLKSTPSGTLFCSGNYINSSEQDNLNSTLDKLNGSSKEDLDYLYQNALLQNADFDSDGSAGIGLIEMKRMTPNKFEYSFTSTESNNIFFVNSIMMDH